MAVALVLEHPVYGLAQRGELFLLEPKRPGFTSAIQRHNAEAALPRLSLGLRRDAYELSEVVFCHVPNATSPLPSGHRAPGSEPSTLQAAMFAEAGSALQVE